MELSDYRTDELKIELKRQEYGLSRPKLLADFDFGPLIEFCQEYIDSIGIINDDKAADRRHEIFETAMETFFGGDVWEYISQQMS